MHVKRSRTLDEDGKETEGPTKTRASQRSIKLTISMLDAMQAQKEIHEKLSSDYFFCTETGAKLSLSNLRNRVWIPALKEAGISYRAMRQTRHTFISMTLSCNESITWIQEVVGHTTP